MERNIGVLDQLVRILIGLVLIVLIFFGPQTWWGLIGVPIIAIAISGTCPLYSLLGMRTCRKCG
ncbi:MULTISPECIES: DUF2892 domain-containing protein [Marinobacterium]|jgi:hypothetical protein|uniref:YgaP family membrane protein n=1 Tax=Marinobacterium TaxID=48075 RepID=UPI001A8DEC34|nr:DUF2892 domain-containing protein [Marinobacterium iners]QSR36880.1 hypothetical protein CFI10_18235 [Marinobacterium iners]